MSMADWWSSDKWNERRGKPSPDSDKGSMDFTDLEFNDGLRGTGNLTANSDGVDRIFGQFSEEDIRDLLESSEVFPGLREKGYDRFELELQILNELDQRIFVRQAGEVLIHLRLKLGYFRFRLHAHEPESKLMYIDWCMTRHPNTRRFRGERLFPGQDMPELGIFAQLTDFMGHLALGVKCRGLVNIPEYFHDALLFVRYCKFYDPQKEIFFRALIRDLRRHGARRISNAFEEGRIRDQDGKTVSWRPGEMISALDGSLKEFLWTDEYHRQVRDGMKTVKFRLVE